MKSNPTRVNTSAAQAEGKYRKLQSKLNSYSGQSSRFYRRESERMMRRLTRKEVSPW